MTTDTLSLKNIIEAAIMAAGEPVSIDRITKLFVEDECPDKKQINDALTELQADYQERPIELKEKASGYAFQVRQNMSLWIARLWDEKAPRYSRALLETLALMAYRQPITRAEVEEVRGVAVSTNIIRTLTEREWVKVIGQKDVPGKPSLYGTTKQFLDYFNLKSLEDLPSLMDIQDLDQAADALSEQLQLPVSGAEEGEAAEDLTESEVVELVAEGEESPTSELVAETE